MLRGLVAIAGVVTLLACAAQPAAAQDPAAAEKAELEMLRSAVKRQAEQLEKLKALEGQVAVLTEEIGRLQKLCLDAGIPAGASPMAATAPAQPPRPKPAAESRPAPADNPALGVLVRQMPRELTPAGRLTSAQIEEAKTARGIWMAGNLVGKTVNAAITIEDVVSTSGSVEVRGQSSGLPALTIGGLPVQDCELVARLTGSDASSFLSLRKGGVIRFSGTIASWDFTWTGRAVTKSSLLLYDCHLLSTLSAPPPPLPQPRIFVAPPPSVPVIPTRGPITPGTRRR